MWGNKWGPGGDGGGAPPSPPLFPCIHTESGGHAETRKFTGLRGDFQKTGGGMVGAGKGNGCLENLNVARLKPLK